MNISTGKQSSTEGNLKRPVNDGLALSASVAISGETARRLDRVTKLFGLAVETQAKAS